MRAATLHVLRAMALVLCALAAAGGARGQVLDSIDVARDGNDALVRIHFAARIQYLRHVPLARGSLVRVYFQITAGEDAVAGTLEETRRAPPSPLIPRLDVVYPPQPSSPQRMLELRFTEPVSFNLRPEDATTLLVTVAIAPERLAKLPPAVPKEAAPAAGPLSTPPAVPPAAATPPPTPTPPQQTSPTPSTSPQSAPSALPEVERDADEHWRNATSALADGATATALAELNRLLNLPPNAHSEEAQAKIGELREQLGDVAKARIEYELYLKLYPDGRFAPRVRERLAALAGAAVPSAAGAPAAPAGPAAERAPPFTKWGSVSQFYYGGRSQVKSKTTTIDPSTNATTIDTQNLAATDQSQLITTVDANGRWRTNDWDNRLVFRDAYTWSFLKDTPSDNRLSALYAETRHGDTNTMARFGRQIGVSGGVLGRFDGFAGSWGPRPDWRWNVVAGRAVDVPDGVHPRFAGVNVDVENLFRGTNANFYVIDQRVEGTTDRVGLGTEWRYFDAQRTAYAIVDYDPLFHAFNIASAQGTLLFPTGTTVNLLADYRRTPSLQLSNVTAVEQTSDLKSLLAQYGAGALRDEAKAFTPISKVYLVGVTHPVTQLWQLGFDFRISSLTGTPATSTVPATQGTDGNVYTYTLQAIGNGLTRFSDILVVNGSVLHGSLLDAWLVGADYRFVPVALVTLEPSLKFYHQSDNTGTRLDRWTPGVRVIYQLREHFSVEGEYSAEKTRTKGDGTDDDTLHHFFYIGWRWIF